MKRTTDIELNGISPSILQRLSSTPCDPQINTLYKIITNTVKPLYIYIYTVHVSISKSPEFKK